MKESQYNTGYQPIAYSLKVIARPGRSFQYTPENPPPGPMGLPVWSVTSGSLHIAFSSAIKRSSISRMPPNIRTASHIIAQKPKTGDTVKPCLSKGSYKEAIVVEALFGASLPSNRYSRTLIACCGAQLCRYGPLRAASAQAFIDMLLLDVKLLFLDADNMGMDKFANRLGAFGTMSAEASPTTAINRSAITDRIFWSMCRREELADIIPAHGNAPKVRPTCRGSPG